MPGFVGTVTVPNIPASITSITVGGVVYAITNGTVVIDARYRDALLTFANSLTATAST